MVHTEQTNFLSTILLIMKTVFWKVQPHGRYSHNELPLVVHEVTKEWVEIPLLTRHLHHRQPVSPQLFGFGLAVKCEDESIRSWDDASWLQTMQHTADDFQPYLKKKKKSIF